MRRTRWIFSILMCLFIDSAAPAYPFPISSYAWGDAQWEQRCKDVRTSYNPDRSLSKTQLTLSPKDERFVDFLYWVWANKIAEHQV
ncbi:MAG: hypothetical protein ACE5MM_09755, partial [Nitrospiraceae bacterium]